MEYKISVIMPALNEEKNICEAINNVINTFNKLSCSGEIIVVDDGSTDNTRLCAENLFSKYNFIKIISNNQTIGIGASFWKGVLAAKGELVVLIPGDAENDSYEILRYMSLMEHVDIVIPFLYNKNVRSFKRRVLSKLYKAIINISFGMLLNYMNGTVIYRRNILLTLSLRNTGFFYQTELLIKAIKKGYLFSEVPYAIKKRNDGISKALSLKSLMKVVSGYLITMISVYSTKQDNSIANNSVSAIRRSEWEKYNYDEKTGLYN